MPNDFVVEISHPDGERLAVYADSLSAISRDDYRFSAHPEYLATFRASFDKLRKVDCDILLTPHPSSSSTLERFVALKPLADPEASRAYADRQSKALDERLAKESAPK